MALPPKTSLQQLLARHGDSPIIYLTTHYVFNKQLNTAGNESAAWRAAAAAALQSGGPDSVEGRGKPGEFGGALAAATAGGSQPPGMLGQGALKQPVATYQGQSAPAVQAVGAMLRLLRGYTLRAGPSGAKKNQLGQVKSLVDPNVVDQVGGSSVKVCGGGGVVHCSARMCGYAAGGACPWQSLVKHAYQTPCSLPRADSVQSALTFLPQSAHCSTLVCSPLVAHTGSSTMLTRLFMQSAFLRNSPCCATDLVGKSLLAARPGGVLTGVHTHRSHLRPAGRGTRRNDGGLHCRGVQHLPPQVGGSFALTA